MEPKFELGETVMTWYAHESLHPMDVVQCLNRHVHGDWGELGEEDKKANDLALRDGSRLFSAYTDRLRTKFWIITEHDRSSTTVLLPSDY